MRILLLDVINDNDEFVEGLGLASIAAVLRKEKYKVKLFKSRISHIKFNGIIEYFPDIIGISVSTWNIKHVLELCTKIKQFIPEVKICVGGYAATFYSNEILRNTQEVDYIIRGEGEYAFLNLVRCLEKQEKLDSVKGLIYKEGQEIITNENQPFINNLDDLPFPSRDVLIDNHLNIASIESSRGCIGNCSYCSLKKFWIGQTESKKTTFREKTIMRVVDEIEDISKNLGISRFSFVDASYEITFFKYDKPLSIAKEIIKRDLNISYFISVRASFYKSLNDEKMKTLLDSGLSGIFLGVESFNEKDLEVFSKTSSVQENISAIEYFIKYPINVDIGFINFHPYSTLEGLRTNAYYLHKYGYSGRFLLIKALRLFKGTDIYNKVEKDNLIKHEDEFNVYQYNFKDKRISLLYDVINNYFNVLNENTNLAQNINYYFNDHLDVMAHLKRYFNKIEDKIALELVNEYEKSVKYYLMELNNINTKWFMEMIDEAENNTSDKNIYLDIMEKHLSAEMLKEINRRLDNNKLLFYRNISKINKEYVRLF